MKSSSKLISIIGLIALTPIASSAITINQAHAYACKTEAYNGAVVHRSKVGARLRARKDWQKRMTNQFGYTWANWSIAKNRSVKCYKAEGGKKLCIAKANPCKHVVG